MIAYGYSCTNTYVGISSFLERWIHVGADSTEIVLHGFSDASERAQHACMSENELEVELTALPLYSPGLMWLLSIRLIVQVGALRRDSTRTIGRSYSCHSEPAARASASLVLFYGRSALDQAPYSVEDVYRQSGFSEIQTTVPKVIWHHVLSEDNPVDCASRGLSPDALVNYQLWWRGP